MKLNWFSPLPPAESDIASYSARLLPTLAEKAEVTLWTDASEWDADLEKLALVRRYDPEHLTWAALNRADMSVYHIGNNAPFHSSIWQVSQRHPGGVVLHDASLQHLFIDYFMHRQRNPPHYFAEMERYYGIEGRRYAEQLFSGGNFQLDYIAKHYPLTSLGAAGALAVLVHTKGAFDLLQRADGPPLAYAPLPFERERAASPPSRSYAVRGAPYRLIVFGHLGKNRCLEATFDALASLPARERFRLDVYGRILDEDYLRTKICACGIDHLVQLHGFVSDEKLDEALAAAHLAINLRYPSMGEASGSQLRLWSWALPSLVTDVDWYARLPDDAVAFVRPGLEFEDIQNHLNAFLRDPESFQKMGARGQRILQQEHTHEKYGETLLQLIAAAQRFRPQAELHRLAERTGKSISAWSNRETGRVAQAIQELSLWR